MSNDGKPNADQTTETEARPEPAEQTKDRIEDSALDAVSGGVAINSAYTINPTVPIN